jgi:hypothetical protein
MSGSQSQYAPPAGTTATGPGPLSHSGVTTSVLGYPANQPAFSSNQMSRFANAHAPPMMQVKAPPPLPPRSYTDFYRNQSFLQTAMPYGMTQPAPAYPTAFAPYPQAHPNATPQFANTMPGAPSSPTGTGVPSQARNPSTDNLGIQNAIDTLLK